MQRKLIGIDPVAYRTLGLGRRIDQEGLAGQGNEIALLRRLVAHDSATAGHQAQQLAECRRSWETTTADLNAQEVRTARALALPAQKTFLLDSHTYQGAGAGALLVLLAQLYFHFHP